MDVSLLEGTFMNMWILAVCCIIIVFAKTQIIDKEEWEERTGSGGS